jgi:hypothetical protein
MSFCVWRRWHLTFDHIASTKPGTEGGEQGRERCPLVCENGTLTERGQEGPRGLANEAGCGHGSLSEGKRENKEGAKGRTRGVNNKTRCIETRKDGAKGPTHK